MKPQKDAADLFLFQRTAALLSGIQWNSQTASAGKITLKAQQEGATATAILRTTPRLALEKLSVVESLTTPLGETKRTQEYAATYALEKGALVLRTVETLDYALKPINKGMHTLHKLEGSQQNVPVADAELAIAMPAGTKISDGRLDRPVRYVQGEQDLTLAELQALIDKKGSMGAKVGAAAPSWALIGLDGIWLQANKRLCTLLGYTNEELQSTVIQDAMRCDTVTGESEAFRQMIAGTLHHHVVADKRYRRRDGSIVKATVTSSMHRDPAGEPQHIISVIESITDRSVG